MAIAKLQMLNFRESYISKERYATVQLLKLNMVHVSFPRGL